MKARSTGRATNLDKTVPQVLLVARRRAAQQYRRSVAHEGDDAQQYERGNEQRSTRIRPVPSLRTSNTCMSQ